MPIKNRYLIYVSLFSLLAGFYYPSVLNAQEPPSSDTIKTGMLMYIPDTIRIKKDTTETVEEHPQDQQMDTGFLLVTSDGKSTLRFNGSIRVNGIYDLNGLQDKENFQTLDIPVGDQNVIEPRFYLSARQTRFGLEATKKTSKDLISMRIEGDFYGEQNALRLRHAYGTYGRFLAGQTWSAFGDARSLPWTVDFEGPNSSVLERTVQIRYRTLIRDKYQFTMSIEAPSADIQAPDSVEVAYQSIPDLVSSITHEANGGHLKFSGVFRNINVKNSAGERESLFGFGFLLSGSKIFSERITLLSQFVFGEGIARYITGLTGRNLDVLYNPMTGQFETLGVYGGYVSLGVVWSEDLSSYFTPGFTAAQNKSYQPEYDFKFSGYFSANVFWDITDGVRLGSEYSYGSRVNIDDEYGIANRYSFIVYYNF